MPIFQGLIIQSWAGKRANMSFKATCFSLNILTVTLPLKPSVFFFGLSALKTRSDCMGETAIIYDVLLRAYLTNHCKYRIFCQDGQETGI